MYVKLFASLYQGTLRGCSDEILVFTNLLAHADQYGIVDKHWRAISEETGLPKERVEKAIINLEAPDPESRSPEMDGSRIVRMDEHRAWGWKIVNYGKYRSIRDEDDRREQNRIAQEKFRNKNKPPKEIVSNSKPASADSNQSKPRKPMSAQAEAEAEAEEKKPLSDYSDEFEQFWKAYPKKTGKGEAYKSWKKQNPKIEYVMAALSWQTIQPDWTKEKGQFIPLPSTYLNQRRWEDGDNNSKSGSFDLNDWMKNK